MSPEKKKRRFTETKEEEEQATIQIGDIVNLSDLLFTETRDYLIKYKDNQLIRDKELAGKVIVLHFVSLVNGRNFWETSAKDLRDIYKKLEPKGGFEVVFVAVRDDIPCRESTSTYSTPCERFEERFSAMPWTAIPFSDLKSRKWLEKRFGIFNIGTYVDNDPASIVIDPRGVVVQSVQSNTNFLFSMYGSEGYPFTEERFKCIAYEDNVARTQQVSISTLLASRERDYVITNKGHQVPLHKLEDKVVGLYIYTDTLNKGITRRLELAYKELSKKMKDFEVVLINLLPPDTCEDALWKTFEAMPWLAIPFEDTDCSKKLLRIFRHFICNPGPEPVSTLVIIGPHGEFIEPLGAKILMKYGIPAYPFSRLSVVNMKIENVKDVKPEMFWDLDTVFRQQNGSEVPFSHIVGKRIIVLIELDLGIEEHILSKLKAFYIQMKNTDDEFEVIHICDEIKVVHLHDNFRSRDEYRSRMKRVAAGIPWLMHPPIADASNAGHVMRRFFNFCANGLVAFDGDGRIVRMTSVPRVGKMVFPFYYTDDMEGDLLLDVENDISGP